MTTQSTGPDARHNHDWTMGSDGNPSCITPGHVEAASPMTGARHCAGCAGWVYDDGSPVGPFPDCDGIEADAASPAALAVRRLHDAVQTFLDTPYPNNGEGRTDRLVWHVPERAFAPLRAALAHPEQEDR